MVQIDRLAQNRIWPELDQGRLLPHIGARFALTEAPRAHGKRWASRQDRACRKALNRTEPARPGQQRILRRCQSPMLGCSCLSPNPSRPRIFCAIKRVFFYECPLPGSQKDPRPALRHLCAHKNTCREHHHTGTRKGPRPDLTRCALANAAPSRYHTPIKGGPQRAGPDPARSMEARGTISTSRGT